MTAQDHYTNSNEAYTSIGLPFLINHSFPNRLKNIIPTYNYIGNVTTEQAGHTGNLIEQNLYKRNDFLNQFSAYLAVLVCILGIGGNFCCMLVMVRRPFNEMAHSIMCAALSLVDLVYMMYHLTAIITSILIGKDVVHFYWLNRPLCKLHIFVPYLCQHLDANIIAGLSIERVICVFRPLQAARIITKLRVKLYLAVLFIFFTLFNGESAIRYDWYQITEGDLVIRICEPMYFYGLSSKYWVIKDIISDLLNSLIPLTIISVCNVALLIKLASRRHMQAQLGVNTNEREQSRTNRMIITITVSFTVLLAPAFIYNIAVSKKNYYDPVLRILAFGVVLNACSNFLLYFLVSSMYRKAVKNLFGFK